MAETCPCVVRHIPQPLVIETHHILPLSWGGTKDKDNQIRICAQTHYSTHFILNNFVRAGVRPLAKPHGWPEFAFELAIRAWDRRIDHHPTPFWMPDWPPIHMGGTHFDKLSEMMGWTDGD